MNFVLKRRRCAALVLDMQTVFISPQGPFQNTTSDALIASLNPFLASCRQLHVPVIFSRYVLRPDLRDAGLLEGQPWLPCLAEGTPLAGVDPRLDVQAGDIAATHNRPSAFYQSDLDAVLRKLKATQLLLLGVSINNAISATARDAFARDIPAVVVRECVAAAPFETPSDAYLSILSTWTAEVANAADVLNRLQSGDGNDDD